MNCEEVEELIGAYALGALPAEALSEIGEHLVTCEKHPEAADLGAVASSLAFAAPDAEPSPTLKTRLMKAIEAEAARPPAAPGRAGWLGRLRGMVRQPALPYALAGALAIAVAALIATNLPDSGDEREFVTFAGAGDIRGRLDLRGDDIVVMEISGLDPLDEDQTYQLWGIGADEAESLGLLGTAPEGKALGAVRADSSEIDALAVSIEPAGGSVAPTSEPVLQALLPDR